MQKNMYRVYKNEIMWKRGSSLEHTALCCLCFDFIHVLSSSQDSVQRVEIKEEGFEECDDHTSTDSGQFRNDPEQDDGDDPDYQVAFSIIYIINLVYIAPFA